MGTDQTSSPGGYTLDIATNLTGVTQWLVDGGALDEAVDTMTFNRRSGAIPARTNWGLVSLLVPLIAGGILAICRQGRRTTTRRAGAGPA
jgi:hypothetical protein